jgi:hypothetical protein
LHPKILEHQDHPNAGTTEEITKAYEDVPKDVESQQDLYECLVA